MVNDVICKYCFAYNRWKYIFSAIENVLVPMCCIIANAFSPSTRFFLIILLPIHPPTPDRISLLLLFSQFSVTGENFTSVYCILRCRGILDKKCNSRCPRVFFFFNRFEISNWFLPFVPCNRWTRLILNHSGHAHILYQVPLVITEMHPLEFQNVSIFGVFEFRKVYCIITSYNTVCIFFQNYERI